MSEYSYPRRRPYVDRFKMNDSLFVSRQKEYIVSHERQDSVSLHSGHNSYSRSRHSYYKRARCSSLRLSDEEDDTYRSRNKRLIEDISPKPKAAAPIRHNLLPQNEKGKSPRRMDWNDYHRLDVIHTFLDDLELDYPSICTTAVIGQSLEGRDLKILKISNSDASNVCVWMDAGIHAREWIAPAVNTFVANHIARNFDNLPTSITNKDWYFLPVVNPDGYEYSHTHDRMWRKSRTWHAGQCVGVDLNRNFSFNWGGKGSSDTPTNAFFRGPRPFSEPESSAIRDVISESGIKFKIYITLHSFGEVIIFPFSSKDDICPDYVRLLEGATVMSKAIYDTNGTIYKVGISRDVMYRASGTSNDWCYGVAGIPFCYLIELRSKKHRFKLPKEEIEETGNEILNCIKALVEFVDNYKPPVIVSPKSSCFGRYVKKNFFVANSLSITHNNRSRDPRSRTNGTNLYQCQIMLQNCSSDNKTKLRKYYLYKSKSNLGKVAPPVQRSQVWEVRFTREGQRYFVKSLDTVGAINIWKEEASTMDIMVEGPRLAQVAGMLHEREIPYAIAVGDLNVVREREQGATVSKTLKRNSSKSRVMDWKNYHRLDVIYAFMENLATEYPYLCSVIVIGQSAEGRDMKVLKISNGNPDNTGVWVDGAIHAREWISTAVVTYMADRLVRTFNELPETVTNKDWYILPVLNPDGYEYTHTHDRMWRKNRTQYGECIGVDLNRNFGYGWGEKGEEGSSDDPGSIFFKGPQPFSEPETAAVRSAILDTSTSFKVFLSFHSYGEVIIFPWGYTSDPCPDYVELLEGGTAMAKAIYESSGHTYKVGSTKDLMYYAAGTSVDWSYAVASIPYSYMVELRGKKHRFLLPKEEIIPTSDEVFNGVLKLMDFVDRRCRSTQSCACPR